MIDVKCKACDKLLLKALVFVGAIKCSRCKMIFEYKIYTNDLYDRTERGIKEAEPNEVKGVKPD